MDKLKMLLLDENKLFFILSVGLSIFIFVIERILIWREKRTSNLSFIENKCITLFSPLIGDIDHLKITYKNKPITENLIFYQATIFNSGISDIPSSSIYKPLSLKLPSQFIWRTFKMYDQSEGLEIKNKIENASLKFEWDLFKKGEFFRFDSVIEYIGDLQSVPIDIANKSKPENKIIHSLSKKISFGDSRIIDLEVSIFNIRTYESFLRWSKTAIYCLIIALSLNALTHRKLDQLVYTFDLDSIPNPIEISIKNHKQIILTDNLKKQYLYNHMEKKPSISKIEIVEKENTKPTDRWEKTMLIICPIMFLLLAEQRRMRKKREKMRLISPGPWNLYKEENC